MLTELDRDAAREVRDVADLVTQQQERKSTGLRGTSPRRSEHGCASMRRDAKNLELYGVSLGIAEEQFRALLSRHGRQRPRLALFGLSASKKEGSPSISRFRGRAPTAPATADPARCPFCKRRATQGNVGELPRSSRRRRRLATLPGSSTETSPWRIKSKRRGSDRVCTSRRERTSTSSTTSRRSSSNSTPWLPTLPCTAAE
jgi:hypothetical protein